MANCSCYSWFRISCFFIQAEFVRIMPVEELSGNSHIFNFSNLVLHKLCLWSGIVYDMKNTFTWSYDFLLLIILNSGKELISRNHIHIAIWLQYEYSQHWYIILTLSLKMWGTSSNNVFWLLWIVWWISLQEFEL